MHPMVHVCMCIVCCVLCNGVWMGVHRMYIYTHLYACVYAYVCICVHAAAVPRKVPCSAHLLLNCARCPCMRAAGFLALTAWQMGLDLCSSEHGVG